MSVWRHFREHAWLARGMGYPPDTRITVRMVAEDRASCLRESAGRRKQIKAGEVDVTIGMHARYEALLSAYSMRGVWK